MYFLFKVLALLPLRMLQNIACFAAWLLCISNSSFKRITSINLKLAYPELTVVQRSKLLHDSIRSQCLSYVECIKCWGMSPQYSLKLLNKIHGANYLKEALSNQKGVIVVVPHFGNWELLNAWLCTYTQPMIMYKPNKIKGINRYILESRQKTNAVLVPADETGVRSIFKHLKQGGLTVILPDHLPKPSGGIYAHFFRQNTLSATIVSKLAYKTQCNVIGLSCIRNTGISSFSVQCVPLSTEILSKDLQKSVECLNQEIELIISQMPEQYIWSYKRFRNCYGNVNPYRV